jgi:hypothetical protein
VPSFIIKPRSHSEIPISSKSARQIMLEQQAAELQQGSRIPHVLDCQINPDKGAHRDAVVQRASSRPSSDSPYPLLQEVNAQHALQPDRRPPARALGIVRFERSQQTRPILHQEVKLRAEFQILKTTPGIGDVLAATIMLETGTIKQFPGVSHFSSYCRCVESKRISNGKKR